MRPAFCVWMLTFPVLEFFYWLRLLCSQIKWSFKRYVLWSLLFSQRTVWRLQLSFRTLVLCIWLSNKQWLLIIWMDCHNPEELCKVTVAWTADILILHTKMRFEDKGQRRCLSEVYWCKLKSHSWEKEYDWGGNSHAIVLSMHWFTIPNTHLSNYSASNFFLLTFTHYLSWPSGANAS